MLYRLLFLSLLIRDIFGVAEGVRRFTPEEAKILKEKNLNFEKTKDNSKEEREELIFGIICLEMDDSMTTYTGKAFKITKFNKKEIYDKFLTLCRVPATYIELLWSQGVSYVPVFYRHGRDDDYLTIMDFTDGMVMIGGTVYNRFPSNYNKDKDIDKVYTELELNYTEETTINKYP